jgi:hypothetical protein
MQNKKLLEKTLQTIPTADLDYFKLSYSEIRAHRKLKRDSKERSGAFFRGGVHCFNVGLQGAFFRGGVHSLLIVALHLTTYIIPL